MGRNVPLTRERSFRRKAQTVLPRVPEKPLCITVEFTWQWHFCVCPTCSFRHLYILMYDDELYLFHLMCKHLNTNIVLSFCLIMISYSTCYWKTYPSTNCSFDEKNYARIFKAVWTDKLQYFWKKKINLFNFLSTSSIS